MSTQHTSTRRHRAISPVLVLTCALLWAQALGLAHRIVHGPQWSGGGHGLAQQAAVDPSGQSDADGLLASLFAGHQGDTDCRLFDQLGHADALPGVPSLALPVLLPLFLDPAATVTVCHSGAALFEARGPPMVR